MQINWASACAIPLASEQRPQHTKDQAHAGVIAPPPLIFAICLLVGYLAHRTLAGPSLGLADLSIREPLAIGLAIIGLGFALIAFVQFRKAGTPAEPWKATEAFVASGIYRFTRNPMYLGMAICFVAAALWLNAAFVLIALVPALVIMEWGVIRREEKYLEAKFGEPYRAYKRAVRRWI